VNTSIAPKPLEVVIFDLGGVLADVPGVASLRELAGVDSDEELWSRWLACQWVRRFESGGCSPQEFAAGVVSDWSLAIEPARFLDSFATWLNVPYDGAEQLVAEVGRTCTVACLSNMNPVHWDTTASHWPLMARLDHTFLSFRLGAVKPDPKIYHQVLEALAVPAERIVFLDDNQVNVDGACAVGIQAHLVRGLDAAREVLARAGIVAR
jgi:putative hydrolase of the HAD superfamily